MYDTTNGANMEAMGERLRMAKQRFKSAKSYRKEYDYVLDEAYKYTVPYRRIFYEDTRRLKVTPEIFDSTATIGVQKFATRMQSMLVPSWQTWMKLEAGTQVSKDDQPTRQLELDEANNVFFNELNHSNFDNQVAESFQDLAISTGALLINPTPIGSKSAVTFKAVPLAQLYPERSDSGSIETVFREHKMRLIEVQEIYPQAKYCQKHLETLEKDPNKIIVLVECTLKDEKTGKFDIMVYDAGMNHIFFEELQQPSSPWVVFRETVIPGETLGYGRILSVLPDIKTINKLKELILKNGSINVSGVYTAVADGVLNPYNFRVQPGATIPVATNSNSNPSLARLDTTADLRWGQEEINYLKATINDALLANPFGSVNEGPAKTATEIAARNSDLFDSVASAFGRMQTEFIEKVVARTVYVLQEAGKIDKDIIINGDDVTLTFVSPLSRLQKSADVENVLEWLSIVGTLGEEVMQSSVKMEDVPAWLAKKYAIPQELQRSKQEQQEMSQTMGQAEAAAAMGQAPGGGGGNAVDTGEFLTSLDPLAPSGGGLL